METETSTEHIKRYSQVDLNRNARFDWRTFNSNLLPQHSLTDKFTAKNEKAISSHESSLPIFRRTCPTGGCTYGTIIRQSLTDIMKNAIDIYR